MASDDRFERPSASEIPDRILRLENRLAALVAQTEASEKWADELEARIQSTGPAASIADHGRELLRLAGRMEVIEMRLDALERFGELLEQMAANVAAQAKRIEELEGKQC